MITILALLIPLEPPTKDLSLAPEPCKTEYVVIQGFEPLVFKTLTCGDFDFDFNDPTDYKPNGKTLIRSKPRMLNRH